MPALLCQNSPLEIACLAANLSSFVLDYVARTKIAGLHASMVVVQQLPVIGASQCSEQIKVTGPTLGSFVQPRALELSYTAWDLAGFAADLGCNCPPFEWHPWRRELLRAELDAAFFHLYGVERGDVDYVVDTFPIVRRKDEATYGEYRTKRIILERFDALTQAIAPGTEYQTVLDPPPADPRVAHPESSRPSCA